MNPARAEKLSTLLQWACAYIAGLYILAYLVVAVSTLNYPFHLEWMEGAVIDTVQRVRHGLPVYAKPSMDYVSFAYTPYYYYVVAFVSLFTGVDFLPARLVSFAASLGTGAIIYRWIRRENGSFSQAFTATGLFFATYIMTGRWMDVSRVDSLFLMLTLAGIYVFYYSRGLQNQLLAAALITAACFTKQTAAIATAPVFAAMLLVDWRHSLQTASMVLTSAILVSLIGHYTTDGWFTFFVYQLESHHNVQTQYLWRFWRSDLFSHVGILMVSSLLLLGYFWRSDRQRGILYTGLAAGLIGCSYAARLNWGGYLNVLMPAACALALLGGLCMTRLRTNASMSAVFSLLILCQFALLYYNPFQYMPNQASIDRGNAFLARIKRVGGEVFMPEVQFVQTRVGKKSYTLGMAALDLLSTDLKDKNYLKQDLLNEIKDAIAQQKFRAVMPGGVVPTPGVRQYYATRETLQYPREFVTVTKNFLHRDLMIAIARQDMKQGQ